MGGEFQPVMNQKLLEKINVRLTMFVLQELLIATFLLGMYFLMGNVDKFAKPLILRDNK